MAAKAPPLHAVLAGSPSAIIAPAVVLVGLYRPILIFAAFRQPPAPLYASFKAFQDIFVFDMLVFTSRE